ncbi:MAG: response regulator [Candidatus Gastranaerophilales bacterium]|nr:response regulator [Candidatus Gastranaerophilales bacterium]
MGQLFHIEESQYLQSFEHLISSFSVQKYKHKILIVDDEKDNLQLLTRTLRSEYDIITASNGQEALHQVEKYGNDISLIISDQRMPIMSGTDLFAKVRMLYPKIIRILLTGFSDVDILIESVNKCELFQYILKPFEPDELKMIVQNGLRVYDLANNKENLLSDLKELFFTTIKSIASALDAKDPYTHGHSQRVTIYALIIANQLDFAESVLEDIETAGLLHDIGKIGVPEDILRKPGKLTDIEFDLIKQHPARGKQILAGIDKLANIACWVNSHHEKWDGWGYPQKLKGEEIPAAARILAIADTYDAMTSDRSYRKGLPHEVAVEEIKNCSGTQFDPSMVEIFLQVAKVFEQAKENPEKYYQTYSLLNKSISLKKD